MGVAMNLGQTLHRIFISNNAKLWTNIVYAVATYKVWVTPLDKISETVFWSWMGIVGGVELVKRVIAAKMGVTAEEPTPGAAAPDTADCPADVGATQEKRRRSK